MSKAVQRTFISKYPLSEIDFYEAIYSTNIWEPIMCELDSPKSTKLTKNDCFMCEMKDNKMNYFLK